ncbi:DUF6311 domain-containing protein [Paraburkholderia sp. RL18-085-BIA-A]|uniref:DUF6311 domain-containing protein n=1 Tax=Paraburkholderia sp. RL18-085-BIA-A TaxID=3031633 RepID=UPI0038B86B07
MWVAGLTIGLVTAVWLYGWRIAIPSNVGWLLQGGDISSHFLGWDMFRRDSWRWPPGANPMLGDIAPNSVVFTDSVPLLALLFKLLRAVLPDPFQYQGFVLIGDFMLNGAFAALLAYRLCRKAVPSLAMAAFVATATIVTSRGPGGHGHDSLTAHWLILAAFVLIWTGQQMATCRRYRLWTLLILASALVHFYLLVMVLAIWAADGIYRFAALPTHRRGLCVHASTVALLLLATMYLAGYFSGAEGVMPDATGFGVFSANVLTFIDPGSSAWYFRSPTGVSSMSVFLRNMPGFGGGQYEGNAYLGVGLLMVVVIGAACWLRGESLRFAAPTCVLSITALLLALAAFSNIVAVGGHELIHVDLPRSLATLAGLVRSSGRFIWVLFYLLIFGCFTSVANHLRPALAASLLMSALAIQLIDLAQWHAYLRRANHGDPAVPAEVGDPRIQAMIAGAHRVVFVPVKDIPDGYIEFTYLAAQHNMAVNSTYSARPVPALLAHDDAVEKHKLLDGRVPPDEFFVVAQQAGVAGAACARPGMTCLPLAGSGLVVMRAPNGLN